jgi:hypothetical protein
MKQISQKVAYIIGEEGISTKLNISAKKLFASWLKSKDRRNLTY